MNNIPKLWQLIKTTLIEKDGTNQVYGSIKRYAAWILLIYAGEIINAGMIPGGSLHLGAFLNLSWNHCAIDRETLSLVLNALGTYVLGGATVTAVANTFQNYHNVKYAKNDNGTPVTPIQP